MNFQHLIRADREYGAVIGTVREQLAAKKPLPLVINGLSDGASAAFLAEAVRDIRTLSSAPVLIFTGKEEEAERVCADLSAAGMDVLLYRQRELTLYSVTASHDTERERLFVLSALLSGKAEVVVTTAPAALLYTVPAARLSGLSMTLSVGDTLAPEALEKKLTALGFSRVDTVEGAGQFARRGGIVDLYPQADGEPVRIEFFGDEIDRMTRFDPVSQRSTDPADGLRLFPAEEVLPDEQAKAAIRRTLGKQIPLASGESREKLERELAALDAGATLYARDKYLSLIYPERETLLSYFENFTRGAVFLLGTAAVRESIRDAAKARKETLAGLFEFSLLDPKIAKYEQGEEEFSRFLSSACVLHVNSFSGSVPGEVSGLFGFRSRRTVAYGGNLSMLIEDLRGYIAGGYRTLLLSGSRGGAEALVHALAENGIEALSLILHPGLAVEGGPAGQVYVGVGESEGFELFTPKIAVLSLAQDEGRAVMANRRRQRVLRRSGGAGQRLLSYADLEVGDYVVHQNYGIGLFEGIRTERVDGISRDYILIRYAGTDKLYVPCDRLEMVGKYIGKRDPDGQVKLSKMGTNDWTRAKSRAKSAAKDIAKDLVLLYAERQRRPGFAFPCDCDLDDRFADDFPYELTASQEAAIRDIKADMMRPVPMNRLLCGDVGFGKTEVALRAAMKAVLGGKQVAFLVPTTILALQHFGTATARFRGYPVSVEMLSRFTTKAGQEKILRRVARGDVDILIGTHKLLGSGVRFHDLGLLIIDEEQRFGVSQKEKLKEFAKNVDVLTLSATPIPRTLNMAMSGINDMSVLEEPPGERRPVQTYVMEHDDLMIEAALRRELQRGGQSLYLYNKVEDIDLVAGRIAKAIPEARVAYAHGQMDRDDLEDIWQMLVRGEIDILVSTTIIESGVDLPNANTLVIENADRFGLSQLHQLRGRVGRSSRQAYAYFTYRPGKALSEVAEKRLKTIREYAEFGAGFKIALCDLEIRGAGNLLGAEQHGYIESVGYDLYVRLLNEAVLEETGRAAEAPTEAVVDIRADATIPEHYISSASGRMEMYKKISLITCEEDLSDVEDEFLDRFGEMPAETVRLCEVALLRALLSAAHIRSAEERGGVLSFHADRPDAALWSEVACAHPGVLLRGGASPLVTYRIGKEDAVHAALGLMKTYRRAGEERDAKAQSGAPAKDGKKPDPGAKEA